MSKSDNVEYKKFYQGLYDKANIEGVQKKKKQDRCNLCKYLQSASNMAEKILTHEGTPDIIYMLKIRYVLFFHNVLNKHPHSKMDCFQSGMKNCRRYQEKYLKEAEEMKRGDLLEYWKQQEIIKLEREIEMRRRKKAAARGETLPVKKPEPIQQVKPVYKPKPKPKAVLPAPVAVRQKRVKSGLRRVFVNQRLVDEFLNVAFFHLEKDVEFCGILAGKLVNNAYMIDHVLIPDQECDQNSVSCLNEMDIFNYITGNDLLQLGWIHTHPTQSAFLSSIDLATHFGYQQMLRESVAIVCSPSKSPTQGIFRIQDSRMEELMLKMKANPQIGRTFVRISSTPMYELCSGFVSCSYEGNVPYEIVDLRKNADRKIKFSRGYKPSVKKSQSQQQKKKGGSGGGGGRFVTTNMGYGAHHGHSNTPSSRPGGGNTMYPSVPNHKTY